LDFKGFSGLFGSVRSRIGWVRSRIGWIRFSGTGLVFHGLVGFSRVGRNGFFEELDVWVFSRIGISFQGLDKNGFSTFFRISNFLLFRLFKELLTYIGTSIR
jgi:hypothetical protein